MNKRVLFVDDDQNLLASFHRNLRNHYEVTTVNDAMKGITQLRGEEQFAVVVADYRMPKINGVQLLAMAKQIAPDTVRIMLTGQADLQAAMNAVNQGSLFRFLMKPCAPQELVDAIDDGLEQYRLVTAEQELLEKTLSGSVKVLIDILATVNPDAFSRSSRVLELAKKIAKQLNAGNEWEIELTVMLSQIGCVTIPGSIISKELAGRPLTVAEREMFNEHPLFGRKLLENIPRLELVAEAIAFQHRNFDGSGFPVDQRKGKEIPLLSRILKVVLDFDSFLMKGKTEADALQELLNNGNKYDPEVIKALERYLADVPFGKGILEIMIHEVRVGMTVAENIIATNGVMLVPKGQKITEVLLRKLQNFSHLKAINEPIKVLKS